VDNRIALPELLLPSTNFNFKLLLKFPSSTAPKGSHSPVTMIKKAWANFEKNDENKMKLSQKMKHLIKKCKNDKQMELNENEDFENKCKFMKTSLPG
jgi:hypothetical protein